ncbi:hypothetical protein EUTSA_v10029510mg [Eutrema salsugineum]|uniref:Replication protein A 70 kDa DNA-binding subunit B/D first OB fold domain-containing protein n=1 Tax=Eutrema salsugineum TaxID=72664 RepID=V4KLA4_EUTSA|nr:hypothetical protein EUTSA_v10029510mg [Eutrema salsugineum]
MASTTKLTPLADVKPYRVGWKVQVKVLHTWKQYQTKSGESLEIILADEMFVTILDDVTNTSFLVDVIGQVESVCELQTISVMNKDTSKLEFPLRNSNDERLPCTLWGKLGEEVYSACQSAGERSIILVIRFGKINVFKDLNDPDVIVFRNSLPENCGHITFLSSKPQQRISYGDEIHFDQFPMVTISELQDCLEVGKCKIMCIIYAVDTDWSWFYLVFTRCGKKVYKIPKKEDPKMTKKNKTLYSCETCDAKVSSVSARYKLHICVMDDTSKIKYPDVVSDAQQNLIGKTFQFLICVEKENFYGGSNTYQVTKVWKGNDVLSADEVNESEDMGDQSLLLSGNKV